MFWKNVNKRFSSLRVALVLMVQIVFMTAARFNRVDTNNTKRSRRNRKEDGHVLLKLGPPTLQGSCDPRTARRSQSMEWMRLSLCFG